MPIVSITWYFGEHIFFLQIRTLRGTTVLKLVIRTAVAAAALKQFSFRQVQIFIRGQFNQADAICQ
jgi:hypothetical protein